MSRSNATVRSESDALVIENITVKRDRMIALVIVDPAHAYTTTELIEVITSTHPHIAEHTCKNSRGATFAAVMDDTSVPHLLEHLIIDEQIRHSPDAHTVFVGTTEWINEKQGRAHVQVSFTDDLVALRAFRDASRILNDAMIK